MLMIQDISKKLVVNNFGYKYCVTSPSKNNYHFLGTKKVFIF